MSRRNIVVAVSIVTVLVFAWAFHRSFHAGLQLDGDKYKEPVLRVLSYSTFVSTFGPGPGLANEFYQRTGVKVKLINAGDSGLIVKKLASDKAIKVDVVLGMDRMLIRDAKQMLQWKDLPDHLFSLVEAELPIAEEKQFLPINWSPLTFIYRKSEVEREELSLGELLGGSYKVSFQDPRLTTPGSHFLFWNETSQLPISDSAYKSARMSSSWSESYALFKRKVIHSVFSYLTSVVFHWDQEKDKDYHFVIADEGHPFQVEFGAVSSRCELCSEGRQFLEFLLEKSSQTIIMQKNFMLPARRDVERIGGFKDLPKLKLIDYSNIDEYLNQKPELSKSFVDKFQ